MTTTRHNLYLRVPRRFALLMICIALIAAQLSAQTFYGSIVGTVTDPSGSSVPGATVTLTNAGTAERRGAM